MSSWAAWSCANCSMRRSSTPPSVNCSVWLRTAGRAGWRASRTSCGFLVRSHRRKSPPAWSRRQGLGPAVGSADAAPAGGPAEAVPAVEAAVIPAANTAALATAADAAAHLAVLLRANRAIKVNIGGAERFAAVEDAARLRDALGVPLPMGVPLAFIEPVADPLGDLVSRYARTHGPFTAAEAAARLGLGVAVVGTALKRLAADGRVVEGEFRPHASPPAVTSGSTALGTADGVEESGDTATAATAPAIPSRLPFCLWPA